MLDLRRLHPDYRPATAELVARLANPSRRQHLLGLPLLTPAPGGSLPATAEPAPAVRREDAASS
jgi:hypothetical protein